MRPSVERTDSEVQEGEKMAEFILVKDEDDCERFINVDYIAELWVSYEVGASEYNITLKNGESVVGNRIVGWSTGCMCDGVQRMIHHLNTGKPSKAVSMFDMA